MVENPKPFDLESIDITEDLIDLFYSPYKVNEADIRSFMETFKFELKQEIKSALEFYFKYKYPGDFIRDFPEERKAFTEDFIALVNADFETKLKNSKKWFNYLLDYREWLLKFAFKEVFEC